MMHGIRPGGLSLLLLAALSGCAPQASRNAGQPTAPCGAPSKLRFHGVHAVTMATPEVTPEEATAVTGGCAIISFGLNSAGAPTAPAIEIERPAGSGVGTIAVAVLSRNV